MTSGAPPPARLTLWGVWERTTAQFVSDTNLAGVNNAGRARHPLRRVLWCCLWAVGLGVTLSDVSLLVTKYLGYPVSTDFTIVYDSRVTFPAVTVCNQNSVMCTKLLENLFISPDDEQLEDLTRLSECLHLSELCHVLYKSFIVTSTMPEMLRNTSCFQTSSNMCCEVSEIGGSLSVNVSWHLTELACREDQLRHCAAPPEEQTGGQGDGQDGGQGEGQVGSQDESQVGGQGESQGGGQDQGQGGGQGQGQNGSQDEGQGGVQGNVSQSRRKKRHLSSPERPSVGHPTITATQVTNEYTTSKYIILPKSQFG